MELVDGPTLADRIAQGPIPLEEALPIARQIADALESAHEHGVIHRDLKPANIKVRPDGTVKVLDFGLAKAFEGEVTTPDVSHSPTLSVAATRLGVILGTAAYMAPEQAKGRSVDKRADIWAFGCVLFEILAGRPAFDGEDASEILASIIKGSANLALLPAGTPPGVSRVIARCLEKDVRRRYRDIGDVRYELEEIRAHPESASAPVAKPPLVRRLPLQWVAATAVLAAIAGATAWNLKPAPTLDSRPTGRFIYTLPSGQTFRNTGRPVIAVSPDGRLIAYNATGGLYLRPMDALNPRLIQGTEEVLTNPFFSPDGQWIGFYSPGDNQLKKIPVAGGTAVGLAKAANLFGASWNADGTILFGQSEGIMRVSANGGTPELVVATEKGEQAHGPQLLPGGQWVLFSLARGSGETRWDVAEIVVQSLASGERRVVWRGGSDARYVTTGHLVYAFEDALFALPFDVARVEASGGPVPLFSGIRRALGMAVNTGSAQYGVSDHGTLVYVAGASLTPQARTLAWVDRSGRENTIPLPPRPYFYPRIAPDGSQVVLDVRDQENDIWMLDLARQTLTRLTFDPTIDRHPEWTPDGQRVVFTSQRAGGIYNLFWQAADGTGETERLADSPGIQGAPSITADGMLLVFDQQGALGTGQVSFDIQVLNLAERRARPLVATMFTERNGIVSRDGRWLAYQSNESGRDEVYVRPFPGVEGGRWQASNGGGRQPLWSPDGRELYFVDPQGRMMAATIRPGPAFVADSPRILFDALIIRNPPGFEGRMYDISPDGQRFLVSKGTEGDDEALPQQIVVVQNWHEELKRLAPAN
jgi:serine/threonine-protein kinase